MREKSCNIHIFKNLDVGVVLISLASSMKLPSHLVLGEAVAIAGGAVAGFAPESEEAYFYSR